MMVSDYSLIS